MREPLRYNICGITKLNFMQLFWTVKSFEELKTMELYHLLQLRESVFILEQTCLYQDIDNKDVHCLHVLGWENEDQQQLAAYARIIPPGLTFIEPGIGRVVTTTQHRGKSIGRALMRQAIPVAQAKYPHTNLRISAQAHLQNFYSEFGFIAEGELYDEDGIPHISMVLPHSTTVSSNE
jgi:ElaA protein